MKKLSKTQRHDIRDVKIIEWLNYSVRVKAGEITVEETRI